MQRFVKLIQQLGEWGMSGDEAIGARGSQQFRIISDDWRAPELRKLMSVLDAIHIYRRYDDMNQAGRGNWPRVRIVSLKRSKGKFVKGLPSNCYNKAWLLSLSEAAKKRLNMQPPIDLSIPDDALK